MQLRAMRIRKGKQQKELAKAIGTDEPMMSKFENYKCLPIPPIENGGTTNTVMKRLRELETRQAELERQILIEKSKTAVMLNKDQIKEFYTQALALEPKLLINYLVKQITLYDDRIEIEYNSPIKQSPDNDNRGFLICSKTVKLSFKVPFRVNLMQYEFEIEMYV